MVKHYYTLERGKEVVDITSYEALTINIIVVEYSFSVIN